MMRHTWSRSLRIVFLAMALFGCRSSAKAEDSRADIVATNLLFPEGTIFVGEMLYFVDYMRSNVLRLVDDKVETVWHQDGCGANGLISVPEGLLVACFDAGTIVKISLGGTTVKTSRRDAEGKPLVAPNDFAADQKGGIYISDSGSSLSPGKVFYLSRDQLHEVASGIRFANGIGVSPDGETLYVAESPTGKVLAFPIKADASLGPSRDFIRLRDYLPSGPTGAVTPDSLRVDNHGNLFVALYHGGGVAIVSPDGRLLKLINVPSQHHTNLAISPNEESFFVTAVDDDAKTTYRGQILRMANPTLP